MTILPPGVAKTELVGLLPVDSAQLLLIDPWYLDAGRDVIDLSDWSTFPGKGARPVWDGFGIVTPTGPGDGRYPMWAEYNEYGEVVAVHVFFEWWL